MFIDVKHVNNYKNVICKWYLINIIVLYLKWSFCFLNLWTTELVNIYLHSFILLVLVSQCLCLLHHGDVETGDFIETVDFKIQQVAFWGTWLVQVLLCTFRFLSYWMGACNSQQLLVHHSLVFFSCWPLVCLMFANSFTWTRS
jgi:hypothetical protein